MKKIISSIKKTVLIIFTFFVTIKNRIIAMNTPMLNPEAAYGVRQPNNKSKNLLIGILLIPFFVMLGLLIYIIRGKNSRKEKIIMSAIVLFALTILIIFLGWVITKN